MDIEHILWIGGGIDKKPGYLEQQLPSVEWTFCVQPGEALRLLEEKKEKKVFEAVFIEEPLEGTNLIRLIKELREHEITLPLIVLLEGGDEAQSVDIVEAGVYDFAVKDPKGNYQKIIPAILEKIRRECKQCLRLTHAVAELKENKEKFRRSFFMNPSSMVISTLEEGRFIEVNENTVKKFGYTRDQMIGKTSVELGLLKPEDRANMKKLLEENGAYENLEMKMYNSSGVEHIGLFSAQVISLGGEPCIIHSVHDITQRKKMEQELIKSKNLESIGILAGGIARDFNNLLTSIIGNISIAKMSAHESDRSKRALNRAEDLSVKASELAAKLLTFSEGGEPIIKENQLQLIVKNTIDFSFSHSRLVFNDHLSKSLLPVMGDENQLNQLFYNIFLNAEQAMAGDGCTVDINGEEIILEPGNPYLLKTGQYIKIVVADNCEGIDPRHLDKIFDPFFSTRDTITRTGVGLGLTICMSIVKKHNGYIAVDSKRGKGTRVTIHLPVYTEEIPMVKDEEHSFLKGTGRILLMEDEEYVREITNKMLEQMGYQVETVIAGQDALTAFKQAHETGNTFDTAILNVFNRQGMGGKEALKEILAMQPGFKAIASGAALKEPDILELKEAGFCEIIKKPYSITILSEILNHVIAGEEPC